MRNGGRLSESVLARLDAIDRRLETLQREIAGHNRDFAAFRARVLTAGSLAVLALLLLDGTLGPAVASLLGR